MEVVPSPQSMVAVKLPAGSAPPACVNVATVALVSGLRSKPLMAEAVPVIAPSVTTVVADAVLFCVLDSAVVVLTVAVSVSEPSSVAVTTIVPVTVAPAATVPRLAVTVLPVLLVVPWLKLAETKATPAGSVSVIVTAWASLGPLLVTVME